jgi:predicted transcriptional regulator/DNA-binding transcriptional ArsR family regulator
MRRAEIEILETLRQRSYSVSGLAAELGRNQGWMSELVSELEARNLVEKNTEVEYADTYEARLLSDLAREYSLTELLAGRKEKILRELHRSPATVSGLETRGFPSSTVYAALKDLRALGAVERQDETYSIADETLTQFLTATASSSVHATEYRANGERLVVVDDGADDDGERTAFSAFRRYGIEYYPSRQYRYQGDSAPGIEEVLIHAVKAAETRKQTAMTVVFYLEHRSILDTSKLWKLAKKWDCVEEWADTLAYADQRDVQNERFLPWEEFVSLAQDYDVFLRGYHPEESLQRGLEQLSETLETAVDAYLLGGGNLILRELKDSTKDLDIVVDDRDSFMALGEALRETGYEERTDLEEAYEKLEPAVVFEKDGSPRYDIFVEVVAGKLQLTEEMKRRVDQVIEYGNLRLHLLSLTDIFLFKSITEREGDLEDIALITRQASVDWNQLLDEVKRQDEVTGQYFSFAVLDTLDILKQRENIDPPIHGQLVSYCLEKALLVSLQNPKTIKNLREELDFPDHRIYNKLRKLEDEGVIEVDRSGTLNEYRVTDER